jgi:hypothetical protein
LSLVDRDELDEFCRRVLGTGEPAAEASLEARQSANGGDRLELLAAAAAACRARANGEPARTAAVPGGLADAVRAEIEQATSKLPERQREALALREALGLRYAEIAEVMRIDPAAVAPLIARARLRLREERRGGPVAVGECEERERALRLLALRQDAESAGDEEADWMLEHIGTCPECGAAHAAMLEASLCYRAAL